MTKFFFCDLVSDFFLLFLDQLFQWRPIVLPDRYIEHASPNEQLDQAGLSGHHIAATALSLLGRTREALLFMCSWLASCPFPDTMNGSWIAPQEEGEPTKQRCKECHFLCIELMLSSTTETNGSFVFWTSNSVNCWESDLIVKILEWRTLLSFF